VKRETRSIPGNSSQRSGPERMMEDARDGEIQVVVVSNLRGTSRSQRFLPVRRQAQPPGHQGN